MGIQRLILAAAIVALSVPSSFAGPCSTEISRVQAGVDRKLAARAASGAGAAESRDARLHRQPTPRSVAAAEDRLGDVPVSLKDVAQAMARARGADNVGTTPPATRRWARWKVCWGCLECISRLEMGRLCPLAQTRAARSRAGD